MRTLPMPSRPSDLTSRLSRGRILTVFGRGDRDFGKRPEMGAAASGGSDWVYVTSDNPRYEDPMAIIQAIPRASMDHTPSSRIAVEPSPSPSVPRSRATSS